MGHNSEYTNTGTLYTSDKTYTYAYEPHTHTNHDTPYSVVIQKVVTKWTSLLRKFAGLEINKNDTFSTVSPGRHGLRAGPSCVSQLLHYHGKILKAVEEKKKYVIYTNFAKVFDTCDEGVTLYQHF